MHVQINKANATAMSLEQPFRACIYLCQQQKNKTRCEICSKLTIKTPERHHWLSPVVLLLALNRLHFSFSISKLLYSSIFVFIRLFSSIFVFIRLFSSILVFLRLIRLYLSIFVFNIWKNTLENEKHPHVVKITVIRKTSGFSLTIIKMLA